MYPRVFLCVIKFAEMGKMCVSHFLQFKKLHIENNAGYNFRIFNNLQYKRDHEKSENKIITKITGYTVYGLSGKPYREFFGLF